MSQGSALGQISGASPSQAPSWTTLLLGETGGWPSSLVSWSAERFRSLGIRNFTIPSKASLVSEPRHPKHPDPPFQTPQFRMTRSETASCAEWLSLACPEVFGSPDRCKEKKLRQ